MIEILKVVILCFVVICGDIGEGDITLEQRAEFAEFGGGFSGFLDTGCFA